MVWFTPLPDYFPVIQFCFSFICWEMTAGTRSSHCMCREQGKTLGECMSFLSTCWGGLTCVLHARQNINAQAILWDWTDNKQFCLWIYFTDPHFLLTGYFRMSLKKNGKCQLGVGTHNCNSASQETGCELTASPRCRERGFKQNWNTDSAGFSWTAPLLWGIPSSNWLKLEEKWQQGLQWRF